MGSASTEVMDEYKNAPIHMMAVSFENGCIELMLRAITLRLVKDEKPRREIRAGDL